MTRVQVRERRKTIHSRTVTATPAAGGTSVREVVQALASLKFTVTLFAMMFVLIFAGTLAQVEKDIWQVIDEYFRTLITWIDLRLFFPPSFFPNRPHVSGGFFFPGGWLLGLLLTVNLLAAHGVRFSVQARGKRLAAGLVAIALGVVLTTSIVVAGATHDGLSQATWFPWWATWRLFQAVHVLAIAAVLFGIWKLERERKAERRLLVAVATGLTAALVWTLVRGEAGRMDDASLRILWQLGKGTLAGLVLLVGCLMVFKKRAGIVLLHSGIGMMMLGELLVGLTAVEGRMTIREGETVNYVYDIRNLELAVVDKSQPGRHEVVSVPESLLHGERMIRHSYLPFDIQVVQFLDNSQVRMAGPNEPNPASAGIGLQWIAESMRPVAATDPTGAVNMPAAYLRLVDTRSAEDLGTHLVGLELSSAELPDKVEVDGRTYYLYLRFKRTYKPYALTLVDVRKDDYPGTDTPRNYSSDVRLVSGGEDRKTKIWMNNPLRFAGDTFYQSGYFRNPETGLETTTLSVVGNSSWMLPYVACMIVATGMLTHFGSTLLRFLKRRTSEQQTQSNPNAHNHAAAGGRKSTARQRWASWAVPVAILLVSAGWLISKARPPYEPAGTMQLYEFGKLPVLYQGRVKPLDTLARNCLRILSDKQTFVDGDGTSQPAIRWLLDVVARPEAAAGHSVFRIENLEVLDTLGLERRQGLRYSFAELEPRLSDLKNQADLAGSIDPDALTVFQKKILALYNKVALYDLLVESFTVPHAGASGRTSAEGNSIDLGAVLEQQQKLAQGQPPLCIPPVSEDEQWQAYSTVWARNLTQPEGKRSSPGPAATAMAAIFSAYAANDADQFNREVDRYAATLAADPPADLNLPKLNFESFFNHFAPFYHAAALYLIAFVLAAFSWLGWTRPLNRAAFWLIVFTLGVHTFALAARMYISGRPPVTNLYSSAVFIGWGCVVLGIVLESIYRIGIGNVVCSISGFVTLVIAHFLAGDGDTFTVLQAVLDTQFWLATHVVCITLGYATTFMAGLLGILYILRGVMTPSLSVGTGRQLSRMIYGTICFATLFSFVGTVLGGLWADDSWGRFWGWDPKENGALMIVLWNALVLHARWGGLVRQRGLANLAVAGNIAVSWSWFGVNELGVGLHSYGFTEGVLRTLGIFVISQLAIIAIGLLPEGMWWSSRRHQKAQMQISAAADA